MRFAEDEWAAGWVMRLKKILYPGKGPEPEPQNGTRLTFHYKVESLSVREGEGISVEAEIEDSRKPWPNGYGAPMELVMGKQFQLPIWETCLATMKLTEVATFDVDPPDLVAYPGVSKKLRDMARDREEPGREHPHHHHCFGMMAETGTGYPALDALSKDPKPLRFTFELLGLEPPGSYEAAGWQLDGEERLSSVETLRGRGKAEFAAGEVAAACETWKEALHRLDTLTLKEKPGEPEWVELDTKKVPFYLNLAQAWLQSDQPYLALQATAEVLQREPGSEKGLFRQAKAKAASWDLAGAREDLGTLLSLHPHLRGLVAAELAAISRREKESKAGDNMYRNMLK